VAGEHDERPVARADLVPERLAVAPRVFPGHLGCDVLGDLGLGTALGRDVHERESPLREPLSCHRARY
jgi:hypothetical protein